VRREGWRVAGPVHIAETREQALADVKFGLGSWLYYFQKVVGLPGIPEQGTPEECLDTMIRAGFVIVGTPDDLIVQVERLEEQSGGFGAFLVTAHEWADRMATRRSYELIARYVMPHFQDTRAYTQRSMEWVKENRAAFLGAAAQGMMEAIQKDVAKRERKATGS
jgi:limonene 1,2-monooxygenase